MALHTKIYSHIRNTPIQFILTISAILDSANLNNVYRFIYALI